MCVMVCAYNPSTQKAEQDCVLKAIMSYIVRPCSNNENKTRLQVLSIYPMAINQELVAKQNTTWMLGQESPT